MLYLCYNIQVFPEGSTPWHAEFHQERGAVQMWEELGISAGTAIIILIALYFTVKWAVKNGVKEAYKETIKKDLKKSNDHQNEND